MKLGSLLEVGNPYDGRGMVLSSAELLVSDPSMSVLSWWAFLANPWEEFRCGIRGVIVVEGPAPHSVVSTRVGGVSSGMS